jgi:hypothetical protein
MTSSGNNRGAAERDDAELLGPGLGNRAHRRREAAKERRGGANGPAYYDVRIRLEGRLDLVDNAEWTRLQLGPLMRLKVPSSTSVFVDIADVTFIEPVALTYFVAQLLKLGFASKSRGNMCGASSP